jgi:hypothetical protein
MLDIARYVQKEFAILSHNRTDCRLLHNSHYSSVWSFFCATMSGFEFSLFMWAFPADVFAWNDPVQGELKASRRRVILTNTLTLDNSPLKECEYCAYEEGFEVQFRKRRVYQTDGH